MGKLATENTLKRKKISVRSVKLSDMEVGFTFSGKYIGISQGQPFNTVDNKTGEVITKTIPSIIMEDAEGNRTAYLADTGLRQAFNDAMVKENQTVEVVKLEKTKLSKGRTMNQYDIFAIN